MIAPIGVTKDMSHVVLEISNQATPLYLAKEVYEGIYVTQVILQILIKINTDIFSLGIVIIEIDNHINFTYDIFKYFQLINSEIPFIGSHINRLSILYKIAFFFLKNDYKKRKDLKSSLDQLNKSYNNKEITIDSSSEIFEEDFDENQLYNLDNNEITQMDTMNDKFNEIFDSFEFQFDRQISKFNESIDLLLKLLNNIGQNPLDQKFRKIKISNPIIREKFFRLKHAGEFLKVMGFEVKIENFEEYYILEDKNFIQLLSFISRIRNRVELFEAKQISQTEYERVLQVQNQKKYLNLKYYEDKKKEQEQIEIMKEYNILNRNEIEIKDSIAPDFDRIRENIQIIQNPLKTLWLEPNQNISGEEEFKLRVLKNKKPVIIQFCNEKDDNSDFLSLVFERASKKNFNVFDIVKINVHDQANQKIKRKHNVYVHTDQYAFLYYKGQIIKEYRYEILCVGQAKEMISKAVQLGK